MTAPEIPVRVCARPGCGKPVMRKRPWARYCADECRDLYWKKVREVAAESVRAAVA